MKVCIYCNRKYPDGDITFHKIPSDEDRRRKWLSAMKLPDDCVTKQSYLCSEHFERNTFSCQIVNNEVHRFLYIDAVPSIFQEKQTQHFDNETLLNGLDERINENPSCSLGVSEECDEDEDGYYYKIENGIIQRYLLTDSRISHLLSSSRQNDSTLLNEGHLEENVKTPLAYKLKNENTEVMLNSAVHIEAPVKVEVLPEIQLPIEMRNDDEFSKSIIGDFKNYDFSFDHGPNLIFEDIKMDAEEIPFEQVIESSDVNGVNDVEVTTCESEPSKIEKPEQQLIAVAADNRETKEEENKTDNLCEDSAINNDTEETLSQTKNNNKKNHTARSNSEIRDKYMKKLLYECLEMNHSNHINVKLKDFSKLTLNELLKTALNYIECLEDKLKLSVEKNCQYETQILEFKNLLESIDRK